MKIVCISDTHNRHNTVNLPPGDVLVHAGDYSMEGRVAETQAFLAWFAAQPHQHKLFIAGNHDFIFETRPQQARAMIPSGVIYLENDGITLDGIRFWGSPITPVFNHWAFNRDPDTIGRYWELIPKDTDVLITHGPPYGRFDQLIDSGEAVGCPQLREALDTRLRPRLHVFGHIHEGYGQMTVGGLTSVNASILNARYQPVNLPVVVTLERR